MADRLVAKGQGAPGQEWLEYERPDGTRYRLFQTTTAPAQPATGTATATDPATQLAGATSGSKLPPPSETGAATMTPGTAAAKTAAGALSGLGNQSPATPVGTAAGDAATQLAAATAPKPVAKGILSPERAAELRAISKKVKEQGFITPEQMDAITKGGEVEVPPPSPEQAQANAIALQRGQPSPNVASPTGQFGGAPPTQPELDTVRAITTGNRPLTDQEKQDFTSAIDNALAKAGYPPRTEPLFVFREPGTGGTGEAGPGTGTAASRPDAAAQLAAATAPGGITPTPFQAPGGEPTTFTPTPFPNLNQPPADAGQAPEPFRPTPLPSEGPPAFLGQRPEAFRPDAFTPPGFDPRTEEELQRSAQAQLATVFDPQKVALEQRREQERLTRQQEEERIRRTLSETEAASRRDVATTAEMLRGQFGVRGVGVAAKSGLLAGAMALVSAAAAREQGTVRGRALEEIRQLAQRGELTEKQIGERLIALERERGQQAVAVMDKLRKEDRQYGLQQRAQALQEWTTQQNAKLQANQLSQQAFEADRNFEESVRRDGLDRAFQRWTAENQVNEAAARMARQVYESDRAFKEQVRQFGMTQALNQWLAENRVGLEAATFKENVRQFGVEQAFRQWATENQLNLQAAQFTRQVYESDRDFQESARRFGLTFALQEYIGKTETALKAAQFAESVRQFGLDHALREAFQDFQLKRGEALLPLEVDTARAQLSGVQLENKARELRNQVAELEAEIAADPDIGRRKEKEVSLAAAKQQLEFVESQIGLNAARTTAAGQEGSVTERVTAAMNQFAQEAQEAAGRGVTYEQALATLRSKAGQLNFPVAEAEAALDRIYGNQTKDRSRAEMNHFASEFAKAVSSLPDYQSALAWATQYQNQSWPNVSITDIANFLRQYYQQATDASATSPGALANLVTKP